MKARWLPSPALTIFLALLWLLLHNTLSFGHVPVSYTHLTLPTTPYV